MLQTITVVVIIAGTGKAIYDGARKACREDESFLQFVDRVRLEISATLALGLTFFLGSEIIKTFRQFSSGGEVHWQQLVRLVVLIFVRLLITWSLEKDVDRLKKRIDNRADEASN